MLAGYERVAKRQTGGRIKDVIGYRQKSAEVIVGGKRGGIDHRGRNSTKLKD
jgi:hypothetical protein